MTTPGYHCQVADGVHGMATRIGQLPRLTLSCLPTPLQPLRNAERAIPGCRAEVLVKRDDLAGFSTAGNKARLLEFLVADAITEGAHTVVGCGPTNSNFVAALAQACAVSDLACEIHIPGVITENPALALARAAGASVASAPVTRHEIDDYVAQRANELSAAGSPAYAIPRGGATSVGAVGYALAAVEVCGQLGDRDDVALVIPAGSCASAAGLWAGLSLLGASHRVVAVSTNRHIDEAREVMLAVGQGVLTALGGSDDGLSDRLTLIDRTDGVSQEDLAAVSRALRHSAMVAPDHYGPATVCEVARAACTPLADTVVWWHTGGVLGMPQMLDTLTRYRAETNSQGDWRNLTEDALWDSRRPRHPPSATV